MTIQVKIHNETVGVGRVRQRPVYRPASRLGAPNTIELRAKDVQEAAGVAEHLFLVYTNAQGKQFYLAGYPERHQLFNWGEIIMKGGEYGNRSPDWEPYIRIATVSGDPQSIYRLYQDLKIQFHRIQNANIPYNLGQNSNSAAMTALKNGLRQRGIDFKLPGNITAPGSNNDLTRFFRQMSRSQLDLAVNSGVEQASATQLNRFPSEQPIAASSEPKRSLDIPIRAKVEQRITELTAAATVSPTIEPGTLAATERAIQAASPSFQETLRHLLDVSQQLAANQAAPQPREHEQLRRNSPSKRDSEIELG